MSARVRAARRECRRPKKKKKKNSARASFLLGYFEGGVVPVVKRQPHRLPRWAAPACWTKEKKKKKGNQKIPLALDNVPAFLREDHSPRSHNSMARPRILAVRRQQTRQLNPARGRPLRKFRLYLTVFILYREVAPRPRRKKTCAQPNRRPAGLDGSRRQRSAA